MTPEQQKALQRLAALAEVKSMAKQKKLATVMAEERRRQAAITALDEERNRVVQAAATSTITDAQASIDWLRWVEMERRRLYLELAQSKVVSHEVKAEAQTALGQEIAASALAKAAKLRR